MNEREDSVSPDTQSRSPSSPEVRIIWRGFRGGYGRIGDYIRCWHLQRWSALDRRHYGLGPVVFSVPERAS